ncbi:MAG: hypothetical protein COS14_13735 [Bacteroidetes bacterium CG02_land_8_20_14_3_00_31_25]|nr:hypothetical protein [Bacteroidota bacterium]PIV57641.1 MAG: hypothetical protein COS14_13735 [Bacteroidetes bacterium CG02_land_8_20_14_3_00_31_25]
MGKQLSENEIKEILKAAFWDVNITKDELFDIFSAKKESIYSVNINKIYSRLLNSYDWYTILSIIDNNKIKDLLKDEVLQLIWPKSVSKKYYNAKRILYK